MTDPTADKDADAITALQAKLAEVEAERDEWKSEAYAFREMWDGQVKRANTLQAQVTEARAALRRIAGGDVDWGHKPAEEMRAIASFALTPTVSDAAQEGGKP